MQIGPHTIDPPLIAAPMAGVTDRPFRQLCRQHGAGLAVSEMLSANTALWGSRKSLRRMDHAGEPGPVAVQILGNDPAQMAEAARLNVEHGAQIIDINMGCPAKKVMKRAAGSALLGDEALVGRICRAVVDAVDVPVTLKIRTGLDPAHRNAPRIGQIAEQAGISALAVHGRSRACKFAGAAEYRTIAAVKAGIGIPVIANGDIDSPAKARRVLDETGADALMIGRAAQGRPWIFREIDHYLQTGANLPSPSAHWIRDLLLQHLQALYDFYGEYQGIRIARKHVAWYSKTATGGAGFRQAINAADSCEQQRQLIRGFFDQLAEREEQAA